MAVYRSRDTDRTKPVLSLSVSQRRAVRESCRVVSRARALGVSLPNWSMLRSALWVGGAAAKPATVLQQTQLAEWVRRSLSARAPGVRRKRRIGPRRRYTWASLLRRVFLIEVLVCPRCGGPRRLLAAI
jgi:hypothetical protein